MKICPDCAESVQDAARKCRYCGYRFDGTPAAPHALHRPQVPATTTDADPPDDDDVAGVDIDALDDFDADIAGHTDTAATIASRPTTAHAGGGGGAGALLLTLGGAAFALTAIAVVVQMFATVPALMPVITWGTPGAGVAIALGWFLWLPSGRGSLLAAFGALAIPAGSVAAYLLVQAGFGAHEAGLRLLFAAPLLGVALAMAAHVSALEFEPGFGFARFGALLAAVGAGLQFLMFVKEQLMSEGLLSALSVVYLIGAVSFGIGLALGSIAARR